MPPRSGPPKPRSKSQGAPFLDPLRLTMAAIDRIRGVAEKSGRLDRMGLPLGDDARAVLVALEPRLPESYLAALREHQSFAGDEELYAPDRIRVALDEVTRLGFDAARYFPIGALHGATVAFDRGVEAQPAEWAVVALRGGGSVGALADSFAHWMDAIADEREEQLAFALSMPDRLSRILVELGFRPSPDRIVYHVDTSDEDALALLLGARAMREARGASGRLFDATGRAHLTFDAFDFSLIVALRVGERVFTADDVFRWFRAFRDEDLMGREGGGPPSHPDRVRDMRRADPEIAAPLRGAFAMHAMPLPGRELIGGAGLHADAFFAVARSREGHSVVYTVEQGKLKRAQRTAEAVHHVHVTASGELWATGETQAIRFAGGSAKAFPIRALNHRAPRGIVGDQPLVWGPDFVAGFDGDRFPPFQPQPALTSEEEVRGLVARGGAVYMLVVGEMVGAVACFDGTAWLPVTEEHMMDGDLVAIDADDSARYVLDARGQVFRSELGMPRALPLNFGHEAFVQDSRERRPLYDVKATAWGFVFATNGGIICSRDEDTVFYEAPNTDAPARVERLGTEPDSPLLVAIGPHLWVWDGGVPTIVDTRKW